MTSVNTDALKSIIKALKGKKPKARVGILGTTTRRDGNSNAFIGACHEFGTSTIPQRSFLRMPISEKLPGALEASGAFSEQSINEIIQSGSLVPWVQKIAILGERIVLDAFHTSGFGRWAPLKPETMERKRVKQILVETQQLRNSITSEVVT